MEIERSVQHIHLDDGQLLAMVQPAFPHCCKIDRYKPISGGALNTTYALTIDNKDYVLRLYARSRAYCRMEQAIFARIEHRVCTPRLLYADASHEPYAYAIFERVFSPPISEVPRTDAPTLCYALGRSLASIHSFSFPQAGIFGDGLSISHPFEEGSSPYFEEAFSVASRSEYVRKRLSDRLMDDVLNFMQKNKEFFPKVHHNACLTHADYKPVNLLYTGKDICVLDWEFAHAGIGLLDFAILLRHRKLFAFDQQALEQGYTDAGGTLPEEWYRSALITDFVNILTLLDGPSERPKLFEQLKQSIQNTLLHWIN